MHQKFFPAGTSDKCFEHFEQMLVTGEFKKFDYGKAADNQKAYGSDKPPAYDWENIEGFNIALICGNSDLLSSPKDFEQLNKVFSEKGATTVHYHAFPHGHMGLLYPTTPEPTDTMF